MRKIILTVVAAMTLVLAASAQNSGEFYKFGNRWALGVGAGTEGAGIDLSTCLSKYVSARVGVNIMPDVTINEDFDIHGEYQGYTLDSDLETESSLKRTTIDVKFDVYPFPNSSSFFITAGASFGGDKLIKIAGHSDEAEKLIAQHNSAKDYANQFGISIDDINIPLDEHGNAAGGVKVSNFRPYFGLGFGRLIPKNRIGFRFELGAQIHGTPEIYADNSDSDLNKLVKENVDNDIVDIIDKLTVYPVLKFSLRGRIF